MRKVLGLFRLKKMKPIFVDTSWKGNQTFPFMVSSHFVYQWNCERRIDYQRSLAPRKVLFDLLPQVSIFDHLTSNLVLTKRGK